MPLCDLHPQAFTLQGEFWDRAVLDTGFPSLSQASLLGKRSPAQVEPRAGCSVCPFWPGQATASQSGESRLTVRGWGLLSWDAFLYQSPGEQGWSSSSVLHRPEGHIKMPHKGYGPAQIAGWVCAPSLCASVYSSVKKEKSNTTCLVGLLWAIHEIMHIKH